MGSIVLQGRKYIRIIQVLYLYLVIQDYECRTKIIIWLGHLYPQGTLGKKLEQKTKMKQWAATNFLKQDVQR